MVTTFQVESYKFQFASIDGSQHKKDFVKKVCRVLAVRDELYEEGVTILKL